MADLTIPLRDQDLKDEIADAFLANYANPESLTGEQLVVKHVQNFLRQVLNDQREKEAVDTAKAAITKESSLE